MTNSKDKKEIAVIYKTTYNLNTGKDENIRPGLENKYEVVWRCRAFVDLQNAKDELHKLVNEQFNNKGAERLTEEEEDEVNKYFYPQPTSLFAGSKRDNYVYFKIGNIAYIYKIGFIFITDEKEI